MMSHDLQTYDVLTGLSMDPVEKLMNALCEQAQNAHNSAGLADQAFHVQLPSKDTPFFAVQNFGSGYVREELVKAYSLEHAEHNIDAAIQAKACFDYASNFFITSVKGQERVEASFFYDIFEDKLDSLMLGPVAKQASDVDGYRISLQAKFVDLDHFVAVALDVLPNYNVVITHNGAPFDMPRLLENTKLSADDTKAQYALDT